MCLVGRNGAGKTTTIDSIMGLLPVRSGRVRLGGRTSRGCPPIGGRSLGIGYSPEDAGIFPDLTVAENFRSASRWPGRPGRGRGGRGNGIDERVLEPLPRDQAFFTGRRGLFLSGGQKKMVAIGAGA